MTGKISILGYKFNEQLYHGLTAIFYRAIREYDGQTIVVKIRKNPYLSLQEKLKFPHQYLIHKNLNIPGITKAYGLENYRSSYALVMEDIPGISQQEYMNVSLKSQREQHSQVKFPICLQDTLSIARQILVEVQKDRVLGDKYNALEIYERAIAGAIENGYLQEAALANELAGEFYYSLDKPKFPQVYQKEAYDYYYRWGTLAKTQQLASKYPQWFVPYSPSFNTITHNQGNTSTILVSQAGITMENAQLYAREQEKNLELQRSEFRFRQLIERSADAILLLDPETITFRECNQAAVDLMGFTNKENLIGLTPLDISPEIQWDGIPSPDKASQVTNLVFENGSHRFDWLHRRVDGEIIWVEIVLTLMQIDGKSTFQCVWRDISDRKHAELALKQQEAEYRTIFESVNDGLAIWDLETGKCVKCNPKQSQMHGYSQEEFLNVSASDLIHPDYLHLFAECMKTVKAGEDFYAEALDKRKDGSFFDIEVRGTQCVYNGKPHGLFIARDITQQKAIEKERKLSETNLRISEQRFRDVTEAAGVYIWEVDINGIYTYITEKVKQVKGYSVSELLGHSPFEFMHPEDIPAVQAILEEVHNQKERLVLQHRNILPNGEITWEEVTGMVMTNEQGEVTGFRGTGMSITERKIAEANIHQKNQELQHTLAQLKHTQAQVVQSEKMSALGNLVAGVAHEINNPVGFLNGSIGNIQEYIEDIFAHLELCQEQVQSNPEIAEHAEEIDLEFLTEDLPKMLDSMQSATNRIKNISTSLRTFSRADTEQKVLANIHDGLNSTLLILKYRLKANEKRPAITITKDYGNLPEIECFPGQLNQVFMNILANAIDMFDEMAQTQTPEALIANPQKIIIATKVTDGKVEIRIKDNGKGMTPEIQTKIFEHLFTTKEVGKGTGLGLAIAKQIIEETHNGKLTCNSQPGQGTEFAVAIPIS